MLPDIVLAADIIRHLPGVTIGCHVELLHLSSIERTGPNATDDGDLVPGFIYGTVPIQSL
jgi:predicted glycoside hydrolase/deacetylase ChbG (UPF0249 family)